MRRLRSIFARHANSTRRQNFFQPALPQSPVLIGTLKSQPIRPRHDRMLGETGQEPSEILRSPFAGDRQPLNADQVDEPESRIAVEFAGQNVGGFEVPMHEAAFMQLANETRQGRNAFAKLSAAIAGGPGQHPIRPSS